MADQEARPRYGPGHGNGGGVARLDLGHFVRPGSETEDGRPRAEAALAYLVRRPEGLLLFDTGIGAGDPEAEAHYRPRRRELGAALAAAGVRAEEIAFVVNCHLHFDHCGGNPLLAGVPILVQRRELATARAGGYTIDALIDFPGAVYEELDGEAEIWPGVHVVATPGHTAGHQSLLVESVADGGAVLLAGQAYDSAFGYASAVLARTVAADGLRGAVADGLEPPLPSLPPYRPWLDRIARSNPRRVFFAHDASVWQPADVC